VSHKKDRWQEVIDGKSKWTCQADGGGDSDVFHTEFVVPLRELKFDGMFDEVLEIMGSRHGKLHVRTIKVLSAINYDHPAPDEDDDE
jgi:hypothetical protein